jgi:hypothetical protein
MKWSGILAGVAILAVLVLLPGGAGAKRAAHACGKVGGVTVHAHRLSCRTARRIYKADSKGHLPRGWVCSASIGRCYRLKAGPARYVSWRPQS